MPKRKASNGMVTPRRTPRRTPGAQRMLDVTIPMLAPLVDRAVGAVANRFNSSTQTDRATSGVINESRNYNITTTRYKKKSKRRISRRGKKKARKFKRSVLNIVGGIKGLKQITRESVINLGTVPVDKCRYQSICVYGNSATETVNGHNDLRAMVGIDGMTSTSAHFRVHGFYGLVTLRNNDTVSLYVDIYEVTNTKPLKNTTASTLNNEFNNNLSSLGSQAGVSAYDTASAGVSDWQVNPFMNNLFLKRYSVISKRTIEMPPNNFVQYEIKDGKNWMYDAEKETDNDYLYKSKFHFFFVRGVPARNLGIDEYSQALLNGLMITYTRTINYTRETAGLNSEMDPAGGIL